MGKNFLLFWDNSFCLLGDNLFCSLMRQFISFLFGKSFILLGEKSILLWENFTLIRDFFLIKKHFCFLKKELLSDISKLISYQHEIDCETTEHKKLQQIQHWLSLAQLSSACYPILLSMCMLLKVECKWFRLKQRIPPLRCKQAAHYKTSNENLHKNRN